MKIAFCDPARMDFSSHTLPIGKTFGDWTDRFDFLKEQAELYKTTLDKFMGVDMGICEIERALFYPDPQYFRIDLDIVYSRKQLESTLFTKFGEGRFLTEQTQATIACTRLPAVIITVKLINIEHDPVRLGAVPVAGHPTESFGCEGLLLVKEMTPRFIRHLLKLNSMCMAKSIELKLAGEDIRDVGGYEITCSPSSHPYMPPIEKRFVGSEADFQQLVAFSDFINKTNDSWVYTHECPLTKRHINAILGRKMLRKKNRDYDLSDLLYLLHALTDCSYYGLLPGKEEPAK